MTEGSRRLILFVLALVLLAGMPAARAEETRPRLPASLLLNLLNVPMESPEAAYREWLRSGPAPRPAPEWKILPDGSARYGTVTVGVIVKNPCPDGTHKSIALPGRRPR
jgi:hypothetical protein